MEDNSRETEKPAISAEDKKKVIELTPEMEIRSDEGVRIYDLTEGLDGTITSPPAETPVPETPRDEDPGDTVTSPENSEGSEPMPSAVEAPTAGDDDSIEALDLEADLDAALVTEGESDSDLALDLQFDIDDTVPEDEHQAKEDALEDVVTEPEVEASTGMDSDELSLSEAEEDEIIELKDIVTEPEVEASTGMDSDELSLSEAEEDEIIELEDVVTELEVEASTGMDSDELSLSEAEEDEIIELEDMVTGPEKEMATARVSDGSQDAAADEDGIIDLIDIVSRPLTPAENEALGDEGVIDLVDIVESSAKTATVGHIEGGAADSGQEISEAAIENYIRQKYRGDIEHLIAKVVEKAVQREIAAIKQNYLEENDD